MDWFAIMRYVFLKKIDCPKTDLQQLFNCQKKKCSFGKNLRTIKTKHKNGFTKFMSVNKGRIRPS